MPDRRQPVPLDRRVSVQGAEAGDRPRSATVSTLRTNRLVVLLGAPGAGKTTVMESEARATGGTYTTVRGFPDVDIGAPSPRLYVDALDESRDASDRGAKIDAVTRWAKKLAPSAFWIACRAEDWRGLSDKGALERLGLDEPVVVTLEGLDRDDARALLAHFGVPDPAGFVATAERRGAVPFLETPLSVRLLATAVGNGAEWPATKTEIFERAIDKLLDEDNEERADVPRTEKARLRDAAGRAFLAMLVSGADHVWQGNRAPDIGDGKPPVRLDDLKLDRAVFDDMLDTALFVGDGQRFEPMHRAIAEFTAGRALAKAVTRAHEPLSFGRARRLVVAEDGKPPDGLRGVFGWFATLLAKQGGADAMRWACRMIEADPLAVAGYGDAGMLPVELKRAAYAALGLSHEKTLRGAWWSLLDTLDLGGLACEALVPEFEAVLDAGPAAGDRFAITLALLAAGPSMARLATRVRAIALDPDMGRPMRHLAVDVVIAWARDPNEARLALLDDLTTEAPSTVREGLRSALAGSLAPARLTIETIRSILRDYASVVDDPVFGLLYALEENLKKHPRLDLFDQPIVADWGGGPGLLGSKAEVGRVLASAFRASWPLMKHEPPEVVLGRLRVTGYDIDWGKTDDKDSALWNAYLANDASREADLLLAIARASEYEHRPFQTFRTFQGLLHRAPSPASFGLLVDRYPGFASVSDRRRVAWIVYGTRSQWPEVAPDLSRLSALIGEDSEVLDIKLHWERPSEPERGSEFEQEWGELGEQTGHRSWLAGLRRQIAAIMAGGDELFDPRLLKAYIGHIGREPGGLQRVLEVSSPEITKAFAAGIDVVARNTVQFDARAFAMAARDGTIARPTLGKLISLDIAASAGLLPEHCDMSIALVAIAKSPAWIQNSHSADVVAWAVNICRRAPVDVAAFLRSVRDAGADCVGARRQKGFEDLLQGIFEHLGDEADFQRMALDLIEDDFRYSCDSLERLIQGAVRFGDQARLERIVSRRLDELELPEDERLLLTVIAFCFEPEAYESAIERARDHAVIREAFDDLGSNALVSVLLRAIPAAAVKALAAIVRIFGPTPVDHLPAHPRPWRPRSGWHDETFPQWLVGRAIEFLTADPSPEAGAALARLADLPDLSARRDQLLSAHAEWAAKHRDRTFGWPAPGAVIAAFERGAPATAGDLFEIVRELLVDEQARAQTAVPTPWRLYWHHPDLDDGEPKIESDCRDALLAGLGPRLGGLGAVDATPEAEQANRRRADIRVTSREGCRLPIECKRHWHSELWTAIDGQLAEYARDPGAAGHGLYVVFWFGVSAGPVPAPPAGTTTPTTADELEAALRATIAPAHRQRLDVIVLDVSRPAGQGGRTPKKRRPRSGKADRR